MGSNDALINNDTTPLFVGEVHSAKGLTIITGQGVLAKGSVLGVITASGKLKLTAAANGDGSEVPIYVLLQEVDTTAADVVRDVGERGDVAEEKLIFGGADTIDTASGNGRTHRENLKASLILPISQNQLTSQDNQ
jgi:hypothetical protein